MGEYSIDIPGSAQNADAEAETLATQLRDVFSANRKILVGFLVARLGSESEAQDVAQEAMLRIYAHRDRITADNLRALLFTTARNIATDRQRAQRRSLIDAGDEAQAIMAEVEDELASPERIVAARQTLQWVKSVIRELPPKCQDAFIAYKFEGQEYAEIAARLQVTESMVRKYVIKALAHCVAQLEAGETS